MISYVTKKNKNWWASCYTRRKINRKDDKENYIDKKIIVKQKLLSEIQVSFK